MMMNDPLTIGKAPMTEDEFCEEMQRIFKPNEVNKVDMQRATALAVDLMEKTLEACGYQSGIKVFREAEGR